MIGLTVFFIFQSFPIQQILDYSKLKELADYNFKFDDYGRKFLKRVENTVEKGEVVRYKRFLFFPLCCQKTYTADIRGFFAKWITTLGKKAFGKGDFLIFQKCFFFPS